MPIILLPQSSQQQNQYPTLQQIRTRVSRKVERGDFYEGVVESGSATAIVDVNLTQDDGHWKGAEVYVLNGVNAGLARAVTDNNGDARSLTVNTFPVAFNAGDKYELRKLHKVAHVDDSIREAIEDAFNLVWVETEDSSLRWDANTIAYDVPVGIDQLYSVDFSDDTSQIHPIRFDHWFIRNQQIVFDTTAMGDFAAPTTLLPNRNQITLRGYRKPSLPQSDSDPVEVASSYVIWYAAADLRGENFSSSATDADSNAQAFSTWMQFGASRMPFKRSVLRPNTRRVR